MNNLSKVKPGTIAWLLPPAYMIHISDEYFSGSGFPVWFSGVFKVDLSIVDFFIINSIGFAATITSVILYNINKLNVFVVGVLGSLFFVNGIIHFLATFFTLTYSPGTLSGILFYLPLGYLIFKIIFPLIPQEQRALCFASGVILQIVAATAAISI